MDQLRYPAYVQRLLDQASALANEDHGQADAAALCYEVLALFPEHVDATELIYTAFCDPHLIYENRKALSRTIDEWDDRHWQQRRRLGKSFSFMSLWDALQTPDGNGEFNPPTDVADMLTEGRLQLMQDHLLGQTKGADIAWGIFQEAIKRSNDPQLVFLWIGHQYAEHGYFVEAVDILDGLETRFPGYNAGRRLWAEARWWRDNQDRIPWIPAAGDGNGRRYHQVMRQIDPTFIDHEQSNQPSHAYMPPKTDNLPPDFQLPTTLSPELAAQLAEILAGDETSEQKKGPVDWGFLERFEKGDLTDIEIPPWAQYILIDLDNSEVELEFKRFLLSYLANPPQTSGDEDIFADE